MDTIRLSNADLEIEFTRDTGVLAHLTACKSGWRILDRPHLGLSFRLLVPLPEQRNNPVYGEKQRLSSYAVAPDGQGATFTWDSVTSEHGGTHPIRLRLTVGLEGRQAIFTLSIDNRSDLVVENVYCPYLGDVQPPDRERSFRTFVPEYGRAAQYSLWPTYQNLRGFCSSDFPVQMGTWFADCGAPMAPFVLLHDGQQGLYAGVRSNSTELVAWQTELHPGYANAIGAQVPRTGTIGGKDVAVRFAAIHLPYVMPGEGRILTPVALEAYQGDWQRGADIYKCWRDGWFHRPTVPAWAAEPHAWQQIQLNSPEDELRIRYADLPRVGEECARHGVKALQVTGWNRGGQDRGNPFHDPDPKLGSTDELRAAIAAIQAMGIKVILFAKQVWADRSSEEFRKDLVRLAVKDPYGDYYLHPGFKYHTATQLLDINTRRLIPMCFQSEEYLRLCRAELDKLVALGPDGILIDECMHHGPALLCFDEQHGHRYGACVYANDRSLIQAFSQSLPAGQEFLVAGEGIYDWEYDAYHLSYMRSQSKDHIPLSRYLNPDAPITTAITGFDDRHLINQCLLYRYIISYEPYQFKGHLDDFPLTVAYGRQMDAMRSELRAYFWDGRFCDKLGAGVQGEDGAPHHPYAVYVNQETGRVGLVIANYSETRAVKVKASADDGSPLRRYRLVDDPAWRSTTEGIELPPCSAAVVI